MESTNKYSKIESREIQIELRDRTVGSGKLAWFARYSTDSDPGASCIELTIDSVGTVKAEAHNYFDALIILRRQCETEGLLILCFGARKDVWASGMQRDMGAGLRAYLLSSRNRNRLIQRLIFDDAPKDTIGTVDEQQEYAENWLADGQGR